MTDPGPPAAEVDVDARLVRSLLAAQHPDLAALPLCFVDEGWDNFVYRLGHRLAVRLPRRSQAVTMLANEQIWLQRLAPSLPVAVPAPERKGMPGPGFAWPWSVVAWVEGELLAECPETRLDPGELAAFLRALHRPAPPEAPANPWRGVSLRERGPRVRERLARHGRGDLLPLWERAESTRAPDARCWVHGDLHARNVMVAGGRICGVIDWGDLHGGDAAVDLAAGWLLLDTPAARAALWADYGAKPAARTRAAGWALAVATAMLDSGEPRHAPLGRVVLERLTDG